MDVALKALIKRAISDVMHVFVEARTRTALKHAHDAAGPEA